MTYLILDIRRKHIDWVGNFNPTNYLLVFLQNYSCKVFLVNMLYPSLPLLYTSKNLTKPFLGERLEKYIQSRKTHRCLLYQISICDIKTIVKRYEKQRPDIGVFKNCLIQNFVSKYFFSLTFTFNHEIVLYAYVEIVWDKLDFKVLF